MRPLRAAALALVSAAAFAGATAQLGAAKDFPDPRWTFAPSNNQFLVYACDGSDTDCTKRGPTTEGAAEKAHVYCSHPTRLDKNGLLEWTRSTFRLGGDDGVFKTLESFSVAQAAGKWTSVPSPEDEYTTGTGGWVFSHISCGTGVQAPIGQGEDVISARFNATRTWKRPELPGVNLRIKQVIRGNVEISGELGDPRQFGSRSDGGQRRLLVAKKGNPSGTVRVIDTLRRCLDAVCDVKRIFKRTTWFRWGTASTGLGILIERDGPPRTQRVRLFAGTVLRSQTPGCAKGPAKRSQLFLEVIDHRFSKGGTTSNQDLIVGKVCGSTFGASQTKPKGKGDNGTANVTFRVRDTGSQPLPTERRPSLAEMG